MEQGLRDCCRSIRIGKILIMSDEDTHEAKVFYAKFPPDIQKRKVLVMYPIMCKFCFVSFDCHVLLRVCLLLPRPMLVTMYVKYSITDQQNRIRFNAINSVYEPDF